MTIDLEAGGVRRTLTVRREGVGWIVVLEGRALAVDVTAVGERWAVRIADHGESPRAPVSRGRSHDVAFESTGNSDLIVHVDGVAVPVTVSDARRGRRRGSGAGAAAPAGPVRVTAPMPGRVLRVLVQPGAPVVRRQPLLVIEAMKMENELRAPQAGTVLEVRAAEGTPVDAGMVLVVIE